MVSRILRTFTAKMPRERHGRAFSQVHLLQAQNLVTLREDPPPATVVAFTIFGYQHWPGSVIAIGNLTTLELEHPWMGITAAEPILVTSVLSARFRYDNKYSIFFKVSRILNASRC